ncbi:hypothetical protein QA052_gp09 [Salmonella phage MET_P1_001_43]|uniref:Uncharacterized protein n=1 Tax=Salmonella phage MET_P1_001_43 TaxID=2982923 RepID=A0A9E8RU36_9CAUD|nr:hypothetical protein QA052_gp09 [Salmonella phage MET_P1_001_43]UZZ64595.1 hypothetical protein [Salmonella phage MET_P1_001_43]
MESNRSSHGSRYPILVVIWPVQLQKRVGGRPGESCFAATTESTGRASEENTTAEAERY